MLHDRTITLSVGNHRRSLQWRRQTMALSQLYEKLRVPVRGEETLRQYMDLSKQEQDDRKDVGGYLAGTLTGERRKAGAVTGRDIVTLDLDSIPAGETEKVLGRIEELGCGYCVYSTRKHAPDTPRLRVLIPLDRTVSADEYEPIARRMAEYIGMQFADPTTFEAARFMYWPSCCADSDYLYIVRDRQMLRADDILGTYEDWRNVASWPQTQRETAYIKRGGRQGDPSTRKGVVGAFCRVYDIYQAMEIFLPGVYQAADNQPNRYTYAGGSTTGGAVVYDQGKFLFSHHATDPCGGRLVNAFDMVRLHKFAGLDEEIPPKTPGNRLPSYAAMCELALADKNVAAETARTQAQAAVEDFAPTEGSRQMGEETGQNRDWTAKLAINRQTGAIKNTIDNIWIILENDINLKNRFAINEFAGRGEVLGPLPWEKSAQRRLWDDNDNQGLYWYLEKYYNITGNGKIDGALSLHSAAHRFNEVRDYLNGLRWDGTPRLDTLFIDYLGAADDPYTRAVTRKAFTAAVARAMTPGCKYDAMVILSGPQGIGKSTLLDKMSRGWFNDSIRTFEGKEASELLQGVWLVEVSELDAFRRTDVARIKQFLSLRADRFRAAYGRHVKELPRRCVFFGTTNCKEFLQDPTGNRRFWPVDVGLYPKKKDVWRDLDREQDQIWAEATVRWRAGETLFLPKELEAPAQAQQEEHREISAWQGIIEDFIESKVPEDWQSWTLDKRRMFWSGAVQGGIPLKERERICALEIWCEALDGNQRDMKNTYATEINHILDKAAGWQRARGVLRFGYCGVQRGFIRNNAAQ